MHQQWIPRLALSVALASGLWIGLFGFFGSASANAEEFPAVYLPPNHVHSDSESVEEAVGSNQTITLITPVSDILNSESNIANPATQEWLRVQDHESAQTSAPIAKSKKTTSSNSKSEKPKEKAQKQDGLKLRSHAELLQPIVYPNANLSPTIAMASQPRIEPLVQPVLREKKNDTEPTLRPAAQAANQHTNQQPAIQEVRMEPLVKKKPESRPSESRINPSDPELETVQPISFTNRIGANGPHINLDGEETASVEDTSSESAKKNKKKEKPPKAVVYYTPLSAIAVFPVMKTGVANAFHDMPLLFSSEFALMLEGQAPETQILNPLLTIESLKAKGQGHLYDKVIRQYHLAGRPEPSSLDYLIKQIEDPDHPVARVVFVEADFDTSNPMDPKGYGGIMDRARGLLDGSKPSVMKYHVRSHIQVFDAESPTMPMIWHFNWRRAVRADRFNNMTSSVYADADSQVALGEASRVLTREMLLLMPKAVYMEEHVDTSVTGELASGRQPEGLPGAGSDSPDIQLKQKSAPPKRPKAETMKQGLYRILR